MSKQGTHVQLPGMRYDEQGRRIAALEAERDRLREERKRLTDDAVTTIHDLRAELERYQRCANCGSWIYCDENTLWTRHDEDGEPCCCQACLDEHEELGCPLEDGGYRVHPREAANARLRGLVGEMEWMLSRSGLKRIHGRDVDDLIARAKLEARDE